MKSEIKFLVGVFGMAVAVFLLGHLFDPLARADTGWEGAPRLEEGRTFENYAVNCPTGTARQILGATVRRPATAIFNNSGYVVWLAGTTSSATVAIGFPVLSSGTFSFYGNVGSLDCIADAAAGAGGVNLRVIRGMSQ